MCVNLVSSWAATREPLLNLPLLLPSLDWRWQTIPIPVILPVPLTPRKGTSQVTLERARFIFEVVHGETQWPVAVVKRFISVASHAPLWRSTFARLSWELRAASWRVGWWRLHSPGRDGERVALGIPTVSSGERTLVALSEPVRCWLVRRVYMGEFTPLQCPWLDLVQVCTVQCSDPTLSRIHAPKCVTAETRYRWSLVIQW